MKNRHEEWRNNRKKAKLWEKGIPFWPTAGHFSKVILDGCQVSFVLMPFNKRSCTLVHFLGCVGKETTSSMQVKYYNQQQHAPSIYPANLKKTPIWLQLDHFVHKCFICSVMMMIIQTQYFGKIVMMDIIPNSWEGTIKIVIESQSYFLFGFMVFFSKELTTAAWRVTLWLSSMNLHKRSGTKPVVVWLFHQKCPWQEGKHHRGMIHCGSGSEANKRATLEQSPFTSLEML